jgi:hypothetical protein
MRPFSLIGNSLPFSLQRRDNPVMNTHEPVHLLDSLFTPARMRKIFSDRERLQNMLDFEAALAQPKVAPASSHPTLRKRFVPCCNPRFPAANTDFDIAEKVLAEIDQSH